MKYPLIKPKPSKVRESAAAYGTPAGPGPVYEIPAGEFKARCLALMDEVQRTGGEFVVTKRGVPVARLVPARVGRRPLLGSMRGTVKVLGDIISPLDEPWEALGDDSEAD